MKEKLQHTADKVSTALRSSRGKDVLTYLMFVAVAFVFWVFMSLDTEVQRDFEVPIEISEVPDSVTLIGQAPEILSVSVKGKDSQMLRFLWGKISPVKFKWKENISDNYMHLPATRIDSRLREYFGPGIELVSYRPDSIHIPFTSRPGVRVKLNIQADVHPNLQYIVSGRPYANVDSVTLYSTNGIPHTLKAVSTEPIVQSELKDTTRFEVKVKPIAGVRIIPDKVIVTVPVEPLIARKRMATIVTQGVPPGKNLVTFPSKVEVSYLVPMSAYNDEYPLKAFVEYEDVKMPGNKIPVSLSMLPSIYHNVSVNPESVEYIIEDAQ
ncbi:hypothetical protein [Duncaniella freteri]|uniref:hypothetical protein n=1 Tax=Duncaniella freteri TaxID=2530391 RepID=UPI00258E1490|nr:hypothetical protein [Duncaniella freteri]